MDRSSSEPYRVLVVDDEPLARSVLRGALEGGGFEVCEAPDGREALERVAEWTPHMVVSDIQMPVVDGFELLELLRGQYPAVRRVLITSGGIDERIALMREHGIGNVIPKGGLDRGEICAYLRALLTGDIFGLERHFPGAEVKRGSVRTPEEARTVCAKVAEGLNARDPLVMEMAVDELVSNAVFHGVLHGTPRSRWHEGYRLEESQSVRVCWARDEHKVGVSVTDPIGRLRRDDVLKWLDLPLQERHGGEEHGRGLLLVRRIIDRFIVNIDPGTCTECIVMQYHQPVGNGHDKPLLVHEL